MKIKEFILENEIVVKNWLIENNVIDEDDIDDVEFVEGGYFNNKEELIETDEVCSVEAYGCDFSFKRKFVKDIYGDSSERELIINNKKVYVLFYNI